jgi:hypothetical protein
MVVSGIGFASSLEHIGSELQQGPNLQAKLGIGSDNARDRFRTKWKKMARHEGDARDKRVKAGMAQQELSHDRFEYSSASIADDEPVDRRVQRPPSSCV